MKILVIGLESAAPELLLGDDRLATIRSLMEIGCYGRLEGVVPSDAGLAWMSLATGQDPGSLGVYGDRDRADRSYKNPEVVDPRSILAPTIWDQVAREGGESILVGGPIGRESEAADPLISRLRFDVPNPPIADKVRLRDAVFKASRDQFEDLQDTIESVPWDYFQFIDTSLDRIQRAFWRDHDPEHPQHDPNGPFADVVRDYYLHLDQEIAGVLDRLAEETVVLVVSTRGAQRLDGGFRINEWLIREGLLTLRSRPDRITPFAKLDVDWSRTKAWSEGGADARIYLNVKGREPEGTIDPADCQRFRDDLKARLEATTDAEGKSLGTLVFKPDELYRHVRNVAPDLIVQFGGLAWRALDGVGARTNHAGAVDAGLDDCNPAQHGAFVLASPALAPIGELKDARVIDVAPTLLQLGGRPPLPDAHGRSLVAGRDSQPPTDAGAAVDDDELVRERLRGLGYIG